MKVRHALRSLWTLGRMHGVGPMLSLGCYAVLHRGSSRALLVALSDPRPLPAAQAAARNHTFRFATVEDLQQFGKDPKLPIGPSDLQALQNGDRCLLQLDGTELVGYTWIASSSVVEIADGFHYSLPDDAVYNSRSYTSPAYRGNGFQALRHLALLRHIRSQGKQRLIGFVDDWNLSSLHGVRKSGYEPVGVLCMSKRGKHIGVRLRVLEHCWCRESRTQNRVGSQETIGRIP